MSSHFKDPFSCLMPQQCTQYILPSTSHFVHPAVNHTRKEERACWQPGVEVPPGQKELMKGGRGRAGVQAQGRLPAGPCAAAQGIRDRRLQRPLNEGRGEMLSLFPLFLLILTPEKYLWGQSGRLVLLSAMLINKGQLCSKGLPPVVHLGSFTSFALPSASQDSSPPLPSPVLWVSELSASPPLHISLQTPCSLLLNSRFSIQ